MSPLAAEDCQYKQKGKDVMNFDFADISTSQLEEINELQQKLSADNKQILLLAVEKKFGFAKLSDEELKKINALEQELSVNGRELVLIALSR